MSTQTEIRIGSEFVGYRIDALIGQGEMGVVYRAYDLRLKRTVALKLIASPLALDQHFRVRFGQEVELAMSLEHPNVAVPVYDAGDVDGRFYLAMRLVDGTDLGMLLRAEGALEPPRAMAICSQVASALDAAHARGLVHRDVKPSNVLMDSSDHVYLADFGFTRRLDDQVGDPGEDRSIGTPAYLAPEQLDGHSVDGRADVYSLGCLLYECLTGERVFPRGTRLAEAWAHLEEEPPRATRRQPSLPEAVDRVISRAMAKEPGERYPTCSALASAANGALGLGKTRLFARRRSILFAAVIFAAIVATAAVGAVLATGHRTAAAPLFARADSLARIDPTTNDVSAVIGVGTHPVVAAAAGHSVWVYNRDGVSISEVDAGTNRVLKTTPISGFTVACCSVFAGPVLAADASGAWFVNGGGRDEPLLSHVLAGGGRKQEYLLDLTPTGVAAGEGALWVVGYRGHASQVVRIDPGSGRVTARTRFPTRARAASIAVGYGAVWVMSSPTATLYRIDPRSARRTGSVVVGNSRATRPAITPYGHDISVRLTDGGGTDANIDPSTLTPSIAGQYGPPDWGEYRGDLGGLWWYDWPTGTVYRQEVANGPIRTIRVTETQPQAGGPCLTSIAVGSGSLWVTAAAGTPNGGPCVR